MTLSRKYHLVPAAMGLAISFLAGCGGGGGTDSAGSTTTTTTSSDSQSASPNQTSTSTLSIAPAISLEPGVFYINPSATWKPFAVADDANVGAVATVDLQALLSSGAVLADTVFDVQVIGTYDATSRGATSNLANNVSALLVDANGAPVKLPSDSTLRPATQVDCLVADATRDPFADDFLIPASTVGKLKVPAGATQLRLSVDDCRFNDNVTTATNPLRLRVAVSTTGS